MITRFSERVLINDKKTRSLLKDFCTKGVQSFVELDESLSTNLPSMLPLLEYIKNQVDLSLPTIKCPNEWAQFIRALASVSPVCGLVHPSEKLFCILKQLQSYEDVTKDVSSMSILQKELPVLFDLLGCISHFPVQSFAPIILCRAWPLLNHPTLTWKT